MVRPDGGPMRSDPMTPSAEMVANGFQMPGSTGGGGQGSIGGYERFGQGPALNTTGGGPGNIQMSLGNDDFSGARQRVEDALMGRLNPQIERDRAAMEASLANRGIRLGSKAYSDAQGDFGRGVAENRTSAILGAGQEQNRLQQLALNAGSFANSAEAQRFGQKITDAGFGNSANQQMFDNRTRTTGANNDLVSRAFGDQITGRNQGINELMALLSGSQVQQPQFPGTGQTGVGGTDVTGTAMGLYNAKNSQYLNQQNQNNSMLGGLFGLGSSALMAFSDERLKDNIEPTGEKVGGVPVKSWTWKGSGEPDVGVIAQDVERKHPELVDHSHPSGYRRVNYGGLMRLGTAANDHMRRAA